MLYGSTLNRGIPYFPNLVLPLVVGAIGLGMINVSLGLSLIASVGVDRIGPTSAIAVMLGSLGGPLVLAVIQAAITSRTLYLGGIHAPLKFMNAAQLHALDHGYTYGLLWLAGAVILVGGVALLIGYTAQQVAHAQEAKKAIDSGDSRARAPRRRDRPRHHRLPLAARNIPVEQDRALAVLAHLDELARLATREP